MTWAIPTYIIPQFESQIEIYPCFPTSKCPIRTAIDTNRPLNRFLQKWISSSVKLNTLGTPLGNPGKTSACNKFIVVFYLPPVKQPNVPPEIHILLYIVVWELALHELQKHKGWHSPPHPVSASVLYIQSTNTKNLLDISIKSRIFYMYINIWWTISRAIRSN